MRTRSVMSALSLIAAGTLIGCGPPAAVESTVPKSGEHHGGVLVPLTDKEAYVELLNGNRVTKAKGKPSESTIVAYLLQPDQKTAYSEPPKSVQVKIGTPKGDQTVILKAEPDSTDPVGSARFVSAPGPYELNQSGGEVTVQVGGKTLSGTFRGPR